MIKILIILSILLSCQNTPQQYKSKPTPIPTQPDQITIITKNIYTPSGDLYAAQIKHVNQNDQVVYKEYIIYYNQQMTRLLYAEYTYANKKTIVKVFAFGEDFKYTQLNYMPVELIF